MTFPARKKNRLSGFDYSSPQRLFHHDLHAQQEKTVLAVAPTISTVAAQMKGAVSKRLGQSIWQKGFHDHVVRTPKDFFEIWQYIEDNPLKWTEDSLFTP